MIKTPVDFLPQITELYRAGLPRGYSTGWRAVDEHYTVARGQWTLITGVPGHGKSEWLDALVTNLAEQRYASKHAWRFAIFSPENQPYELHVAKLLEKRLGKPFGAGPTTRMSEAEMQAGVADLRKQFAFIRPEQPTLSAILSEAGEWAAAFRENLVRDMPLGVVIDPWNELEHWRPANQTEAEYLSACLSAIRQFSRDIAGHVWIVAHPRLMPRDKAGAYPVPTPYDVSGGAHWRNKADACICVWRDLEADHQETEIHVQKIRFKHVGKLGLVTLRYDKVTGRYYESTNGASIDARSRAANDYERASRGE